MNVKIYYNKQWIDITNNVLLGQITLADRCDEAFGVGNFSFESKVINDIIPAYSILLIDSTYYLCSSTMTENLITGTYIHNVEVLDATAILSRYIVGSKNFSVKGTNTYDSNKVGILNTLMNQKYGINISYNEGDLRSLSKQIEYTFGAGNTYYDCLCEILKNYNKRIKVTSITDTTINCKLINLDGSEYTLNTNNILNYEFSQNVDDYCKSLEGEMTNVIDRSNLTILNKYTCRIEDVKLDYDNCKIILPTRIEKLNKFGVYGKGFFNLLNIKGEYLSIFRTVYSQNGGWDYDIPEEAKPISYWISCMASSNEELDFPESSTALFKVIQQIANAYNLNVYSLYSLKFKVGGGNSFVNSKGEYDYMFDLYWDDSNTNLNYLADFTQWVVEKSKYDVLTNREKPSYAYYKSGDNYIDGMNVTYKDDFWNQILGITKAPFFSQHNIGSDEVFSDSPSGMYALVSKQPLNTNPVLNIYHIEYYAITNPMVVVNKEKNMLNCSRSYSKGSNFIDFDKLIDSMQIDNSYLGEPELAIELDVTNEVNLPVVANKIYFKDKYWYLMNYTITYSLNGTIMNLNLASNYNKLADVIGVSTQFEETKNPLNNIIDRSILIEKPNTYINKDNLWLKFKFDSGTSLFKRATLLEKDDIRIIYCEMVDFYCFDKTTILEKGSVYSCEDVAYVNTYNEAYKVDIDVVELPDLTFEESMALPYYTGSYEVDLSITNLYIYKDSRERLLFTILLK